ncbi:MAG: tRNA (adenosine(37)-N6)-threonylcarbamoyltransferase complex dimerization subunit type 1 TsaB [Candidatus Omnitrophica bacterium]|nr:tRNA (adenosine(37)-N6)-threonylcarbamoyltransferase complex dimerization subunit type 1 TsaB [Candidatus Omnitrophota bacterium]MDD5573997.1 tRNA (adenosine(37)-N6)-threonylcarbamoyltransferase complex dimerization subunit type 1 TsaB [Candidatus Omnitrophota bacterium]
MNVLCVDTSTPFSVVAVVRNMKMVAGARRRFEKGRAEGIFCLIKECLKASRMDIKDMDAFGVGVGPGSFTGLRIGLSAVKGFSLALSRPIYPFSSLEAIAFNAGPSVRRLSVAVDARRSNVYAAEFRRDRRGGLRSFRKDALLGVDIWLDRADGAAVFSGDAVGLYASELQGRLGRLVSLEEDLWYPTPESIVVLTGRALRERRRTDAHGLRAAYLYARDCQVKRTC